MNRNVAHAAKNTVEMYSLTFTYFAKNIYVTIWNRSKGSQRAQRILPLVNVARGPGGSGQGAV